ncbi:MAG: CD225/dispanin family protein [Acidobacteriota bacterium]
MWFYVENDAQRGPVTEEQFRALVEEGAVSATTLVWRDGQGDWASASQVLPSLFGPASASVPPLPDDLQEALGSEPSAGSEGASATSSPSATAGPTAFDAAAAGSSGAASAAAGASAGATGYQPPASLTGAVPPGQEPVPDYLVLSILATLLCCLPAGIVSIVYSSKANNARRYGDYAGGHEAARIARVWLIASVGLVLIPLILYLFVIFFAAIVGAVGS